MVDDLHVAAGVDAGEVGQDREREPRVVVQGAHDLDQVGRAHPDLGLVVALADGAREPVAERGLEPLAQLAIHRQTSVGTVGPIGPLVPLAAAILDQLLELHHPVDQALRPGRAAGHVDVDRHDPVDALDRGVAPLVAAARARAVAHRDAPLGLRHLLPQADERARPSSSSACRRRSARRPGAGWRGTGTCPSGPCRSSTSPPTSSRSRSRRGPTAAATGCSSGSGRGPGRPWSG